jgi:hypothetical protein
MHAWTDVGLVSCGVFRALKPNGLQQGGGRRGQDNASVRPDANRRIDLESENAWARSRQREPSPDSVTGILLLVVLSALGT